MPSRNTTRGAALPLLLLLATPLTGCQWLIGGDGSECTSAIDCPEHMICSAARCVDDPSPGAPLDASEDAVIDMSLDQALDATLDATLDDPLDMVVPPMDAGLPGEIGPIFPDGQCFAGLTSVQLGAGITYVPHGLCTRFGVLWTSDTPSGRALNIARRWPHNGTALALPIAAQARVSTADGRFIAVAVVGRNGDAAPALIDLAKTAPEAIVIRQIPVTEVRRGPDLTAYVSEGTLFVTPDSSDFGPFLDCGQPRMRQWGVQVSQGRVAWFERAEVGGPARVIIADALTCRNRVVFPAQGEIAADARIESAGDRWLWIAARGEQTHVAGLAPDARGRLRPLDLETPVSPIQIAAHDDWLAVVSYVDGTWRIEAQDLVRPRVRDLSDGSINHLNPLIWNGYLSWAILKPEGWGVQYAPLF